MKKILLATLITIFACLALLTSCGTTRNEPQITYTDFIVTKENRAQVGFTDTENEHLVIPETFQGEDGTWYKVVAISSNAFERCYNLVGVTIPNTVERIGDMAFHKCALENIILPDHTRIGQMVFLDTSFYYNSDNWGDDDTLYLNKHLIAVKNATGEFTVKDGTTVIGGAALADFPITDINIPDSVQIIGEYAFSNTNITTINIPETVTYIGNGAFSNCNLLKSIKIPDKVTAIPTYMCSNCTSLTDIKLHDNITSIEHGAFSDCTSLTSIDFPESVESIGNSCFSGCTALTSFTPPKKVEEFSNKLLYGCTALKDITIPDTIKKIGDMTFSQCTALEKVTFEGNVTSIGSQAFWKCTALKKLSLPDSLSYLGYEAFADCTALSEIEIGEGITSIQYSPFKNTAFYNNESNWENGVLYIGNCLFSANSTVSDAYTIKQGTVTIANNAFQMCADLVSVTIPSSVINIGSGTFSACPKLTEITVDKDNPILHSSGNCLIETQTKTLISACIASVIPDDGSVTSIGDHAFYSCNIESIIIPSAITSIGNNAFKWADFKTLTIPKSVTVIGEGAFDECDDLKITYDGTVEEWNKIEKTLLTHFMSYTTVTVICTDETIRCR